MKLKYAAAAAVVLAVVFWIGCYFWDRVLLYYASVVLALLAGGGLFQVYLARHRLKLQNLTQEREEIRAEQRAHHELFATLTQELRTPLQAINGYVELLQRQELSPEQMQLVQAIQDASAHTAQLAGAGQDYARIQAGKFNPDKHDCFLNTLMRNLETVLRPLALDKNLKFEIRPATSLPARIRTDAHRLQLSLLCLARHALRCTDKGRAA